MSRRMSLALLLIAISAGIAAAAGPSPAAPAVPAIPKIRQAKLKLDVAGYVEVRRLTDTTSDCFPGESFTQTNTFQFETSGYVNVRLTNISIPGTGKSSLQSSMSASAGRTSTEGAISGYRSTNYCSGPQAALKGPPKQCRTVRGRTAVSFISSDAPTGADDDLAPLKGRTLLLQVFRKGGGQQGPDCISPNADSVADPFSEISYVTTSDLPTGSLGVNTGLDAVKVFALRSGRTLKRSIRIEGPCAKVTVTPQSAPGQAPNRGSLNADGDCWISGRVVVSLRARGR